jgi:hypothetical protein
MTKKTNEKVSKSIEAWGLKRREFNPEGRITSIQWDKPRNLITYEYNEVVPVLITEITK